MELFWEQVLGEKASQLEVDEQSTMGRGKRERRQVQHNLNFHVIALVENANRLFICGVC
jgi:hypothetical protein